MTRLFRRTGAVTVGTARFGAPIKQVTRQQPTIDFAFVVERSLDREPNTAEIQIYNLSDTSRKLIEQTEDQRVELEAGYLQPDGVRVIFDGDLSKAKSFREGPDIITEISAADGERQYRTARINRSFGDNTSLSSVIEACGRAINVGVGNLAELATQSGFEGLGNIFSEGVVVSGPAREELSGLIESAGLEWSIQNNTLQILPRGSALAGTAVVLSPKTGLIESPSVDSEGVATARMLMIPDVFPGRRVRLESDFVLGEYRVTKAKYSGATRGNEWFIDIEGKPIDAN